LLLVLKKKKMAHLAANHNMVFPFSPQASYPARCMRPRGCICRVIMDEDKFGLMFLNGNGVQVRFATGSNFNVHP
jgi:hypothetical protein